MNKYQINFTGDEDFESAVINYHIVEATNIQNAWRYALFALQDDACFNMEDMNEVELIKYRELINSGQYEKAIHFYVYFERSQIKEVEISILEPANADDPAYMCQNCGDIVIEYLHNSSCCKKCNSTQINKLS